MTNLLKEHALEKTKLTMEGELGVARQIQMSLVPKTFPPVPVRDEFSLYATLEPAREVGGDLYDFYFVGDNRFFFMTDGVTEATNKQKNFFIEARLLNVLNGTNGISTWGVVEKTMSAVHQFACGSTPADDTILLALRMEPVFEGGKRALSNG